MPQCKAETLSHTRCISEVSAPSRSLCGRHQSILAVGKPVVDFETGRKFPMPTPRPASPEGTRKRAQVVAASTRQSEATVTVKRGPGEHALVCDAAHCGQRALAGSDYCMKHQGLA